MWQVFIHLTILAKIHVQFLRIGGRRLFWDAPKTHWCVLLAECLQDLILILAEKSEKFYEFGILCPRFIEST